MNIKKFDHKNICCNVGGFKFLRGEHTHEALAQTKVAALIATYILLDMQYG